ncbi:hypothetical protein M378DRAFT_164159 [Amanita muscaria Koide BX008]|uniref:Uncharacterized protein n=1 Tax=Amanita muscaria (strain Koide BX008) TaxID=946122 RepID=A0A0C2SKH4_AMAMK|nr:hypothetical protein M378DRAFT_164159 [Amanita muscaria Koide BX008]
MHDCYWIYCHLHKLNLHHQEQSHPVVGQASLLTLKTRSSSLQRRRTIDQAREERLKARLAEDGKEDNKKHGVGATKRYMRLIMSDVA